MLHIEVTQEGLATNIHLMGQSQIWQDKLQKGLLSWDHDKNIITNILTVFGNNCKHILFIESKVTGLKKHIVFSILLCCCSS